MAALYVPSLLPAASPATLVSAATARPRRVTDEERTFGRDEVIVSKTDLNGRITYANEVFLRVAGYREEEVLGAPHSLVRHPDMPRIVFQVLWETIAAGKEIFAYVKNLAADGACYWVFAHVTPTFDERGQILGYHSNRRCPERRAVAEIARVYQTLLAVERREAGGRGDLRASREALVAFLVQQGTSWDRLMFAL